MPISDISLAPFLIIRKIFRACASYMYLYLYLSFVSLMHDMKYRCAFELNLGLFGSFGASGICNLRTLFFWVLNPLLALVAGFRVEPLQSEI